MQSTTLAAPKTQQKPPMQASRCPKKAMGGLFCQPDPALRLSISHYVGTLTFNGPAPAARSGTQARRPSWGSGWSSRLNPLRPRDSRIQRRGLLVVDASASGASRPLRPYLQTTYKHTTCWDLHHLGFLPAQSSKCTPRQTSPLVSFLSRC